MVLIFSYFISTRSLVKKNLEYTEQVIFKNAIVLVATIQTYNTIANIETVDIVDKVDSVQTYMLRQEAVSIDSLE